MAIKTLAIRLDEGLHAQLVILAQLDGVPLVEEIRQAIEGHVAAKRSHPEFAAQAKEVLADIDREASARRNAIQALFEEKGTTETEETASPASSTSKSKGRQA